MDFKKHIAANIAAEGLSKEEICSMLALPPNTEMGDFALPCFKLAKTMRKAPALIAKEIAADYKTDDIVTEVSAVNGYVNFRIGRAPFFRPESGTARQKYFPQLLFFRHHALSAPAEEAVAARNDCQYSMRSLIFAS